MGLMTSHLLIFHLPQLDFMVEGPFYMVKASLIMQNMDYGASWMVLPCFFEICGRFVPSTKENMLWYMGFSDHQNADITLTNVCKTLSTQ
jgi:hypothetical protein